MDEFRAKQTNPYSRQPEPVKQTVNFNKHPEPVAHSPAPEPVAAQLPPAPEPAVTMSYQPPTPHHTTPTQTMDVVAKRRNKGIPKVLIFVPLALLTFSALSGGGYWLHQRQVAKIESQSEELKQQVASLKAGGIGSPATGQGLSLLGGSNNSGGEVAGASDSSDVVEGNIFAGQVIVNNNRVLFEAYANTEATGKVESIWVNYGGNENNLVQQTDKTTEGLGDEDGIIQLIAYGDLSDFEAGSSYLYRVSIKSKNGKTYKSGISVFTLPAAPEGRERSSTGSGL